MSVSWKVVLAAAAAVVLVGNAPLPANERSDAGTARRVEERSIAPVDAPRQASPSDAAEIEAEHQRARQVVSEVLARREFADLRPVPESLWNRLVRWFFQLLEKALSAIHGLPEWLVWVFIVWMLLTLAAILGHLLYTLWKLVGGRLWQRPGNVATRRHPGEFLGIRELDFDSVYAEARRLLGAGDWLAATRYLYVAAILGLDRLGWLAFRPASTNRDYLAQLAERAALQGVFRRLTDNFESVAYGGQSASMSATQEMAQSVEGLLHEPARAAAN